MIRFLDPDQKARRLALGTPAGFVAFGFGSGLSSFAPGTVGTIAAIPLAYLLKILPTGTHEYAKFIQPAELDEWGRRAGLDLLDLTGLHYSPFTETFSLGGNVDVNYLAHFRAATTA